jgi:hypothetical protein
MEIYRELYQISKDLREFTNKATMLHDILKGDEPIKLSPGEVARFDEPDWEERFDSMCEEFYFHPGGSDLRVKAHPSKVKDFIRTILAEQHLADSIEPDDV